jgi:hypothetical protein
MIQASNNLLVERGGVCVTRLGVATAIMRARQAAMHKVSEGARLFQEETSRLFPFGRPRLALSPFWPGFAPLWPISGADADLSTSLVGKACRASYPPTAPNASS